VLSSRLVRYFVVGTFATICQFTALVVLVELLHIAEFAAVVGAFFVGVAVNYALQRRFTFNSAISHSTAASRFVATAVLSAVINSALFGILNIYLPYVLAQFIATLVLFAANYQINSKFTFQANSRV
jgi:putative flippase GtrA